MRNVPTDERLAALADAAFLEDLAGSFVRAAYKQREKKNGAVARGGAQQFMSNAERLHLIAQRLRGMQP